MLKSWAFSSCSQTKVMVHDGKKIIGINPCSIMGLDNREDKVVDLNLTKPNRKYEAIIILHPDATEEEQKQLFQKNAEIIKSFSGEVNHLDTWGKRKLGNPIEKVPVGTFFHTTFEAQTECIAELERTMKINDRVLRVQHTKLDDRKSLSQHLDDFRNVLSLSSKREQEREAKVQSKKAANKRK